MKVVFSFLRSRLLGLAQWLRPMAGPVVVPLAVLATLGSPVSAMAQSAYLTAVLGYPPRKLSYTIYVAKTGEQIDGYAVIDEEKGQHLPITFAVQFSRDGAVQRQEIMVYRERYGDEIRDPRFRQQFVGKHSRSPLREGEEVIALSGATISSRAMVIGVRRALVLLDELVIKPAAKQPVGAAAKPASSS